MADQKISQLNELTSPLSGDTLPIVNSGETKKITVSNLLSGSNIQPYFISRDTGSAENYKVGDNVWLGDVGTSDMLVVKGVNDTGSAYVKFGLANTHQNPYIGHDSGEEANVLSVVADTTKFSNAIIVGSGSLVSGNPEMVHVYSSGSYNIVYLKGNSDTYSQINVKNENSGSDASTDIVATADNGDELIRYVDLGINSSNYSGSGVGYPNDAYLYNVGNDLYIGTVSAEAGHSHLHLYSADNWERPQITLFSQNKIGFNATGVTSGYTYEFSGSVKIQNDGGSETLISGDPEMLHVYSSGSYNIAYFVGDSQTYSQINVKNTNGSSSASSDIVATADNGNEEIHYIDMGINSSGFNNAFSIGYQNDAYVYNNGQDLYLGSMNSSSPDHGHVHIFASGSWENSEINVLSNHKVGFNTGSVTNGYNFEFSGSVKLQNDLQVDGGMTGSLDWTNLINVPSFVTGATYEEVTYSELYSVNPVLDIILLFL